MFVETAGAFGLKHKEQRTVQKLQSLQNAVKERILSELSQSFLRMQWQQDLRCGHAVEALNYAFVLRKLGVVAVLDIRQQGEDTWATLLDIRQQGEDTWAPPQLH